MSVLIDLYRSADPASESLTDEMADRIADPGQGCAENLYDLLDTLPPSDARLLRLRLEGYDGAVIAERTGLDREAVYKRISRIVKRIKKRYGTD